MSLVLTETARLGNVLKHEYDPSSGFTREVVTVNLAAGATLVAGTVLAKVTATGKYIVQDSSLASGSGLESAGVLLGSDELHPYAVIPTTTDTKVLMLARGPAVVAKQSLVFGAGTDTDAEKLAEYTRLAALGIVVSEQI